MDKNYCPILSNTTKETFFDYIDSLDIPQIDYFAIGSITQFLIKGQAKQKLVNNTVLIR